MTLVTNSFEGGTSGTSISASNSGGASGTAFTGIVSTAPTFSNTHTAHGSMAMHAGGGEVYWSTQIGTQTEIWFRAYLYAAATPTVTGIIILMRTSGNSLCGDIELSTGLALVVQASGGTIHTMTNTVPLNQWIRLEGFFVGSASAGQIGLNTYFTMDSTTATESYTSPATENTAGAMGLYEFGSTSASCPVWMDDLGVSTTGFIGPVASSATPVPLLQSPAYAVQRAATW